MGGWRRNDAEGAVRKTGGGGHDRHGQQESRPSQAPGERVRAGPSRHSTPSAAPAARPPHGLNRASATPPGRTPPSGAARAYRPPFIRNVATPPTHVRSTASPLRLARTRAVVAPTAPPPPPPACPERPR